MKILITDNIDRRAAEKLTQSGFSVEVLPTLSVEELKNKISAYHGIAIRSATRIDGDLLKLAYNLKLIVRGGVGVDNINLSAASKLGIAVANTPGANTIAAVELTMALMLGLARQVVQAQNSLVRGEWNRRQFRGVELFGKTLGLIGLGRIGREVARRARAFGMRVLAYDPYLEKESFLEVNAKQVTLSQIYGQSDFISLHLPLTDQSRGMIGRQAIQNMKRGVRIINCSRGGLIDEHTAATALKEGIIAGIALDVYETEPPPRNHPLIGHPHVISVPHLGAYTFEAQVRVAEEVAKVMIDFFLNNRKTNIVNG